MCAKCIFRHELLGNLSGKAGLDSPRDIDFGKLPLLELRVIREFAPFPREIGISVSDCELTETYSPAAMDIAPATSPAMPASNTLV
jgi:hypothetical protein